MSSADSPIIQITQLGPERAVELAPRIVTAAFQAPQPRQPSSPVPMSSDGKADGSRQRWSANRPSKRGTRRAMKAGDKPTMPCESQLDRPGNA